MFIFYLIAALALGLVFGSFMNVLIYRIPRDQSIIKPSSYCPLCTNPIRWYSNIPVFSWVAQRGKCIDCDGKISVQYPLVELTTGILFVLIFLKFGATILTVKYLIFVFLLLGAGFTDLFTALDSEHFDSGIIPNGYTIGGVFIGYIWALFTEPGALSSFAGSGAGAFSLLIVGYFYALLSKRPGMGDGDAMLMGMVGSFLGLHSILFVMTAGALLGTVVGLIVVFITKNRYKSFPFGPMLAAAAILYIFFGEWFNSFIY